MFGNVLAILCGLAGDAMAQPIVRTLEAAKAADPYPVRVVLHRRSRQDELWRSYMARHQQNHRAPVPQRRHLALRRRLLGDGAGQARQARRRRATRLARLARVNASTTGASPSGSTARRWRRWGWPGRAGMPRPSCSRCRRCRRRPPQRSRTRRHAREASGPRRQRERRPAGAASAPAPVHAGRGSTQPPGPRIHDLAEVLRFEPQSVPPAALFQLALSRSNAGFHGKRF